MKLLVDIGNSRIKWALFDGEQMTQHGLCSHEDFLRGDMRDWDEILAPDAVYCASVAAGEIDTTLQQQVLQRWQCTVLMLESSAQCAGVSNAYNEPQSLGVDRWAAMIAAYSLCAGVVLVVDCGSAITVDAVDTQGKHLGGYIVPGLRLQHELLQRGTAGVKTDRHSSNHTNWGTTTADAVQAGVLQASAGLIERARQKLIESSAVPVEVVITGGDADVVLPLLDFPVRHETDLVLRGIALIAKASGAE